jgi:hypothetical protein
MPLNRIFENTTKSFGADDVVGYLKSGMQIDGRPVALDSWRITSGDPEVMKTVSEAFGGEVEKWETTTEHDHQVLTEMSSLDVELVSVQSNFALWGRQISPSGSVTVSHRLTTTRLLVHVLQIRRNTKKQLELEQRAVHQSECWFD